MKHGCLRAISFVFVVCATWLGWGAGMAAAETALIQTGMGANSCRLLLQFPTGEQIVFQHRWDGSTLDAKIFLEEIIGATGGELVVTDGYSTPFDFAVQEMANPASSGLVVHYQGSYELPYLNGIRWNGPGGLVGADYQYPDNWWHLWVQGPAHVDQSLGWPDPLPPVDLVPGSAWFFGEYSGLADLTLSNGASIGLVYGSSSEPSPAAPAVQSVLLTSGNSLQIRFSSVPGARYQLEGRQDLTEGAWIPVGDPITATAASTVISAPSDHPAGRGFYRLGLLP